jgi:hypothetical protein
VRDLHAADIVASIDELRENERKKEGTIMQWRNEERVSWYIGEWVDGNEGESDKGNVILEAPSKSKSKQHSDTHTLLYL